MVTHLMGADLNNIIRTQKLSDDRSKLKNVISIYVWMYYIKSFTGLVTKMYDCANQKYNKIYIIPI